jgi:hypothetical protein
MINEILIVIIITELCLIYAYTLYKIMESL